MNRISKLTTATELNYNLLAIKTNELIDKLDRYKSIVKKVDPDNLPEGEVLAFDGALSCVGEIVYFRGVVCECSDGESYLNNVTHYIEQKDLIKMISEV